LSKLNPFPLLSPDELPKSVKGALKGLIAKAIERDVDQRWHSAHEMIRVLNQILNE